MVSALASDLSSVRDGSSKSFVRRRISTATSNLAASGDESKDARNVERLRARSFLRRLDWTPELFSFQARVFLRSHDGVTQHQFCMFKSDFLMT
jgi:hypothetical protein